MNEFVGKWSKIKWGKIKYTKQVKNVCNDKKGTSTKFFKSA